MRSPRTLCCWLADAPKFGVVAMDRVAPCAARLIVERHSADWRSMLTDVDVETMRVDSRGRLRDPRPWQWRACRRSRDRSPGHEVTHPFIPVVAMPWISCRWKMMKAMISGRLAINEPAISTG